LHESADGTTMETKTNAFGDFQFNGLFPGHLYKLVIKMDGYSPYEMDIEFKGDTTLKEINLILQRLFEKEQH
jgi:hypothetical protein